VVDIGTNSVQLLLTQLTTSSELKTIDRLKDSLRLINDRQEQTDIATSHVDQLVEILRSMKNLADPHHPVYRVVATQGLRATANYEDFIEQVQNQLGLHLEIIDGHEEARLSFIGMLHATGTGSEPRLYLDIGGGSTELLVAQGDSIRWLTSLKLGALHLSQSFFQLKSAKPQSIQDLKQFLDHRLAPLAPEINRFQVREAVGTAGTVKNAARIHHAMAHGWTPDDIDGYSLSREQLDEVCDRLCQLKSPKKIKEQYGIDAKRADILVAGCLLLQKITHTFGITQWRVSSYGLREGLSLDTYARLGHLAPSNEKMGREAHLEAFAGRFQTDRPYALTMAQLACRAYDQLAPHFPPQSYLTQDDVKTLLTAAARLYEVGKFVSFHGYHQHAYYLITEGQVIGFTQEERYLIALAIRFSRKKPAAEAPKGHWPYLKRHFHEVNLLAFCLRLARCLNRSRRNLLPDFQLQTNSKTITLELKLASRKQAGPEFRSLQQEEKNLGRTLGRSFQVAIKSPEAEKHGTY
jgi:exopolyphosphatase/guanosine-5'-triphosphate,3'-diphosphate pyrophosphatase